MDWMAAETVPGSERATPPPIADDYQPPPGVEIGKTELELYPELRGPKGTVGMPRMTFPEYVSGESGASSLEDYLQQQQQSKKQRLPTGNERLYAGYRLKAINRGAFSTVDAFAGPVIEDWTFSVMEMAVQCTDPQSGKTEVIGIMASRDRRNFRNSFHDLSQLYLQVEHYILDPNNPEEKLRKIGGFAGGDENWPGFKWITNHKYHPNETGAGERLLLRRARQRPDQGAVL